MVHGRRVPGERPEVHRYQVRFSGCGVCLRQVVREDARGRGEVPVEEGTHRRGQGRDRSGASGCDNRPRPSAATPAPVENATAQDDWAARYKGASKKINELQTEIDAVRAECEALKKTDGENVQKIVALEGTLKDFNAQVEKAGYQDLAALIGAVSTLKADLEKSGKDLAATREQLNHMKATRDLLTAGVLSPSNGADSYEAKMAAAKTPQERENLRAMKKAGKIK